MMVVWVIAFFMMSLYFLYDILALQGAKKTSELKQKEKQC